MNLSALLLSAYLLAAFADHIITVCSIGKNGIGEKNPIMRWVFENAPILGWLNPLIGTLIMWVIILTTAKLGHGWMGCIVVIVSFALRLSIVIKNILLIRKTGMT